KHKDKIAKRGEQFFMDNFGLKVKATNVVGSGDGVEVFVHCDDHDIVFNASIPFDKSIIESDSSLRSEDKGDDMSTLVVEKGKNQNHLSDAQVERIIDTYKRKATIDKYSYSATLQEIADNDYNLNIPRYVDTFEEEAPIDLDQVQQDLKNIDKEI
ncbi:DUF1672 family protein, partial [Staphylococcus aureus]